MKTKLAFLLVALFAMNSAQALDALSSKGRTCATGDSRCALPMDWLPMNSLFSAMQRGVQVADASAAVERQGLDRLSGAGQTDACSNPFAGFMPFGFGAGPCLTR